MRSKYKNFVSSEGPVIHSVIFVFFYYQKYYILNKTPGGESGRHGEPRGDAAVRSALRADTSHPAERE